MTVHRESRGLVVVLAGPDGAGKSSVGDALEAQARQEARRVSRFHHRPHVLPSNADATSTSHEEPQSDPPYPVVLSILKTLYLAVDYALGWRVRISPVTRRGDLVILERGWHDLQVDPLRYRLGGVAGLVSLFARVMPQPAVTVILQASPEISFSRKRELSLEELGRQNEVWARLASRMKNAYTVDADQPLEQVVDDVLRALSETARRIHGER